MKGPKPVYRPSEPPKRPKAPQSRVPKAPSAYRPAPKRDRSAD